MGAPAANVRSGIITDASRCGMFRLWADCNGRSGFPLAPGFALAAPFGLAGFEESGGQRLARP